MIKKMKHLYVGLILLALIGGFLGIFNTAAYGEEAAVQTNGEIIFSTEIGTSTSSSEPVEKPRGKLPSTGELVVKSFIISGIVLAAFVILFYLNKRKKDMSEKEG